MTTGASVPPPPPLSPPPPPGVPVKKKTSPLVWVLVGCLGLFVVGGIIFAAVGYFAVKKAKNYVEDFADNPVKSAAEAMVKLNPDLDLVSTDDAAQTMTVKNNKTGEVATFNWADIQEGKFTFESDGESYTIDGSGAEDGSIAVQDGSGKEVVTFGADAGEVPSWFPQYATATDVNVLVNATQNGQESMIWTFLTPDAVANVIGFYEQNLQGAGWEVAKSTSTSGDISNGSIDARKDNGASTLNLVISKSGADPAQVMVTYTGTAGG